MATTYTSWLKVISVKLRAMLHWLAGVIGRDDSMRTPPLDLPSAVSIEELVAGRQDLSALPVLSLQKYRKAIEGIPCPTSRQIEDFACYVSGAKSWYKHLPLVPPGEIFTFYIDPWAGMDRILARNRSSHVYNSHKRHAKVPLHVDDD